MVANLSLYAIFDLSFKIALISNSIMTAISIPMLAVFSSNKRQIRKMIVLSYKIFGISLVLYLIMLLGFYFFGELIISFLNLNVMNKDLLYSITFILLISLGSIASVEVFYRYFLGYKQLKMALLLKLIIPIGCLAFFLLFKNLEIIYRLIYAYGASLMLNAFFMLLTFIFHSKAKLKHEL